MMYRWSKNAFESLRGFGLLEVLIAMLIVVLVALPLLQSGTSIHHRTTFTEFHVLAAVRARTVVSVLHALDFAVLHKAVGGAPGATFTDVDIGALVDPDAFKLLLSAPSPSYKERAQLMSQSIQGRVVDGDEVAVQVTVRWVIPAESRPTPHEYKLATVIHRPEATMSMAVPLTP